MFCGAIAWLNRGQRRSRNPGPSPCQYADRGTSQALCTISGEGPAKQLYSYFRSESLASVATLILRDSFPPRLGIAEYSTICSVLICFLDVPFLFTLRACRPCAGPGLFTDENSPFHSQEYEHGRFLGYRVCRPQMSAIPSPDVCSHVCRPTRSTWLLETGPQIDFSTVCAPC